MSDITPEFLTATVVKILNETIQDWDLELEEEIGAKTTLTNDLEFESIDVVQLLVAIEQALGRKGLPFEQLFIEDGAYVDDVSVTQIVEFLMQELQAA